MRLWNDLVRQALRGLALLMCTPAMADVAYITCQTGDALSVIDLGRSADVTTWDVPGKPAGVATGSNYVLTVSADSKVIRKLDAATGAVLVQTKLDGGPIGVSLDDQRQRVYVSDWYNARIWVLDLDTLSTISILTTGEAPAGLSLSEDGRWLASADKEANQVTLFDAQSLTKIHQVAVGTRPFGLNFAPDGRLFVGNVGSNDLTVVDPDIGRAVATVPVGQRPYGVSFAKGRAFVTNQYENTVSVIDTNSLQHVQTIDVGEYPEGVDTVADGTKVVLANWFDNTISIIDANTLSVIETLPTCDGPRAFGRFLVKGAVQ
ncbi:MAG: beta-propeller fold lactonase family protein [Pseudomonadota bacterium]